MTDEISGDKSPESPGLSPGVPTIEERIAALEAESRAHKAQKQSEDIPQPIRSGERWIIGINGALLVATIAIAYIYIGQLNQMTLATKASTDAAQAAQTQVMQSDGQFERTVTQLIYQTVSQANSAKATQQAADAARSAVEVSRESLRISERAYVGASDPEVFPDQKELRFKVSNTGHIPATNILVIAHKAIFPVADAASTVFNFSPIEIRWKRISNPEIPPGGSFSAVNPFNFLSRDKYFSGNQVVIVAGTIEYEDGLKTDGVQHASYCFQTQRYAATADILIVPCNPNNNILQRMIEADGYPNDEEKP